MISNILKYHAAKGPKKWILWLVISIASFIAIFAIYKRLKVRGKELEKLHAEVDEADRKTAQIQYEVMREKSSDKIAALLLEAQKLKALAEAKRAEIAKNDKEFDTDLKQVKALESWKDLDAYNEKSRS